MVKRCRSCKEYEEHIYWKHQNVVHFTRQMSTDFVKLLRIPKKFTEHFRGELSEVVKLEGPSGNIWNVGLVRTGYEVSFQQGWTQLVEDHSLVDGDLLVFSYEGDSQFSFLVFDRNGCEKVSSHFIKKSTNQSKNGCHVKKRARKDFAGPSHPVVHISHTSPEEPESNYERKLQQPIPVNKTQPSGQAGRESQYVLVCRGKRKVIPGEFAPNTVNWNSEVKSTKTRRQDAKQPSGSYPLHFISSRRTVTEEEKDQAWQQALKFDTARPCFKARMQLTHVSRRFSMVIPADFVRDHHLENSQTVAVKIPSGKSWQVFYEYRGKVSSVLNGGWQDFVFDNNLEEGDACVFELITSVRKQVAFVVHIFRVVQEVVPLTRYMNNISAKKKQKLGSAKGGIRRGRWAQKPIHVD